jgi:hypothetical protein
MTPQVKLDGTEQVAQASAASPVQTELQTPHKPTYSER